MCAQQTVVCINSVESRWQQAFERLAESDVLSGIRVALVPNAKKALKFLRKNPDTAVIIVSVSALDNTEAEHLSNSIRHAMHNHSVRIMACAEDEKTSGSALVLDESKQSI